MSRYSNYGGWNRRQPGWKRDTEESLDRLVGLGVRSAVKDVTRPHRVMFYREQIAVLKFQLAYYEAMLWLEQEQEKSAYPAAVDVVAGGNIFSPALAELSLQEGTPGDEWTDGGLDDGAGEATPSKDGCGQTRDGQGHDLLSWTACYDDDCLVHKQGKEGAGYFPRPPRRRRGGR